MSDRAAFQITPEEDRFLRAFFRRQAGRYLVGLGALAVAGVGLALRTAPEAAPHPAEQAALTVLRAENEKLESRLVELAGRVERLAAAPDPAEPMGALEEQVAGALRRLDRVEGRLQKLPAAPSGELADANAILERLYDLESRQKRAEKGRETFEKGVLSRLYAVENGRDSVAQASTATQQSILGRLEVLEQRADVLERGPGAPGLPAAPAP
jgi:hypothetical protein